MKSQLVNLIYEIELQPGDKLTLPETLVSSVNAGNLTRGRSDTGTRRSFYYG